jgi:signal transduction histidine kinase
MHDVLAHKISLIALQAGGLEVNPEVGAERVEQTAGLIRSTAREALEELREVLGVMRADQPVGAPAGTAAAHPQLTPQPGVADLPALAESSRAAGVRVTLAQQDLDWIPQATGRTVYRVVQEALTNVHKHARGAATDVSVTGSSTTGAAGEVRVCVTNQRPVSADTLLPGSGAGLIGLRERVALVGGTLTAGPTADGGWRVDARLPASAKPSSGKTAPPANLSAGQQGTAWLAS